MFIAAAAAHGMRAWPIIFRGRRGCPDILLCNQNKYRCLVELKTVAGVLKPYQTPTHMMLMPWIDVYVTYGLKPALDLLKIIVPRRN